MKIINPATEEIIKEIQEDTQQTIETKFESLRSAQADWQKRSVQFSIVMPLSGLERCPPTFSPRRLGSFGVGWARPIFPTTTHPTATTAFIGLVNLPHSTDDANHSGISFNAGREDCRRETV